MHVPRNAARVDDGVHTGGHDTTRAGHAPEGISRGYKRSQADGSRYQVVEVHG